MVFEHGVDVLIVADIRFIEFADQFAVGGEGEIGLVHIEPEDVAVDKVGVKAFHEIFLLVPGSLLIFYVFVECLVASEQEEQLVAGKDLVG